MSRKNELIELIQNVHNIGKDTTKYLNDMLAVNVKKLKMTLKLGSKSKIVHIDPKENDLMHLYMTLDSDVAQLFDNIAKNIFIMGDVMFIKSSGKVYSLSRMWCHGFDNEIKSFIYDTTGYHALHILHICSHYRRMEAATFYNFLKGTDLEEPANKLMELSDKLMNMSNDELVKLAIEHKDVNIQRVFTKLEKAIYEHRKENLPEDIQKYFNE